MQQPHPRNENRFAAVQPRGDDGKESVRDPLRAGAPQRIGWFRFYFDDGRWVWSPQVEKMHGYLPGTVTPTTEMVLAHQHPDDYRQIADTLDLIRQTRQAFSSRHRIIDVHGRIHHVVVVGDLLREADRTVIGTHGYYVDVTPIGTRTPGPGDRRRGRYRRVASRHRADQGHVDAHLRHG